MIVFTLVFFYAWKEDYKNNFDLEGSRFVELFDGLKETRSARLFNFMVFLRRVVSIGWIIIFQDYNIIFRTIVYALLQIPFYVFIIKVKPYEETRDNIVEIINDAFFAVTTIFFIILTDEEDWTGWMTRIVLLILSINGLVVMIVQNIYLGCDIISSIKSKASKCKCKKKKSEEEYMTSNDSIVNEEKIEPIEENKVQIQ
jgi:hypothetical protein